MQAADKADGKVTVVTRLPVRIDISSSKVLDMTSTPVITALCAVFNDISNCDEMGLLKNGGKNWRSDYRDKNLEAPTHAIGRVAAEVGFGGLQAKSDAAEVAGALNSVWFVKVGETLAATPSGYEVSGIRTLRDGGTIRVAVDSSNAVSKLTCWNAAQFEPKPFTFPIDFAVGVRMQETISPAVPAAHRK